MPFLKLKSNEILSLSVLEDDLKDSLVPFFDFPRKTEGYTEDSFKDTAGRLLRSVNKNLNGITELYLDNFDIESDLQVDGACSYDYLVKSFGEFPIIPVVSIDRDDEHIKAISDGKRSGDIQSNVIALRLLHEDFESFHLTSKDISDNLSELFELFEYIDLVLDCRICLNLDLEKLASDIASFAWQFVNAYPTRKVVVTGSSITASIRDIIQVDDSIEYPRAEIEVFRKAEKSLKNDGLDLWLGDYGVVSPNYSDVDIIPEAMQNVTAPKIIYSFEDNHFVIRGSAIRTHHRGLRQYYDLAASLVSKPFYRGAGFSFGDNFLEEKSRSEGNLVTPSSIIKPATNAHISFMLKTFY